MKRSQLWPIFGALILMALLAALICTAGCANTLTGVGKDLQHFGEAMTPANHNVEN
jgi:predicted small secreted protein